MITKSIATTEAEALSEAKKQSEACLKPVYLFFCIRSNEYSMSKIQSPYAPIFAGGYVPLLIAAFLNGQVITINQTLRI